MPSPLTNTLRHIIGLRSPIRIVYHWLRGALAYLFSGNPAKGMYIIGVTGTKGKTTTSTLIARALEESGKVVALFSTAQVWMAGEKRENRTKMTMDSPFKLWKMMREARNAGVTHFVLETSSHGIYYFRNFGVKYNAVMLTNISQDHLDLHGTMDHYARTKARLFKPEKNKIAILPKDSEYFELFEATCDNRSATSDENTDTHDARRHTQNVFTYSMNESADYEMQALTMGEGSMELLIHSESPIVENARLIVPLVGKFNAENILGAFTLLRSIGIETHTISEAWREFTGVPGRMESVPNNQGITVLVDYAHTENSLRSVLETLRSTEFVSKTKRESLSLKNNPFNGSKKPLPPRLFVVFGATGDRDTNKRPKMGAVVDILADVIILTDDDPYTEDSMKIIKMIQAGIDREVGDTLQIIPDRKSAILWALEHAVKGDTIIIAGKGCETIQVTNNGPIPWSDRGIVEEYFR